MKSKLKYAFRVLLLMVVIMGGVEVYGQKPIRRQRGTRTETTQQQTTTNTNNSNRNNSNSGNNRRQSQQTTQPTAQQSQPTSVTELQNGDIKVVVNGVSFVMKPVQGGTFTMGATSEQGNDAESDEKPTHRVTVSDFYMGETEVTQALWKAVMGSNPSYFKGDNLPVETVSWNDCQEFIRKLNSLTGKNFSLPTEAEWEYAARGGNRSSGYKYSGSNSISSVAWYWDNANEKTHAVKQKQANELGLYDMSGNVWEWCKDWYGDYSGSSQTNPVGPSTGSNRVLRGGSWGSSAGYCRVSNRNNIDPGNSYDISGLRLRLSVY